MNSSKTQERHTGNRKKYQGTDIVYSCGMVGHRNRLGSIPAALSGLVCVPSHFPEQRLEIEPRNRLEGISESLLYSGGLAIQANYERWFEGKLIFILWGSKIGFRYPASRHLFWPHPAIAPDRESSSRSHQPLRQAYFNDVSIYEGMLKGFKVAWATEPSK